MVTPLLQIPTRGFRTEIDADEEGDDRKEGRTEFKPPSNPPNSLQRQVGAQTEEDTEGNPHLPTHNQTTSNRSGDVFGSENWDRGRFRTHTNAEQQTADEKLLPALAKSGTDDWDETEDCAEEDGTATSEIVVEWI